jgi:hypothetical protein
MLLRFYPAFLGTRIPFYALFAFSATYLLIYHLLPAVNHDAFPPPTTTPKRPTEYPYPAASTRSVNLVVASTSTDDIAWTADLRIPNLNIIRYVRDDPSAQYHPPVSKGRDALMYFTYMRDFYDQLPDVSVFVHGRETDDQVDSALQQSMSFALSQLDLDAVARRQYFNLRVSWKDGCDAWINTTRVGKEAETPEEGVMAAAFRANFGDQVPVPEFFEGPCCSQFAVTRELIQRRTKEDYQRYMDWLIDSRLQEGLADRVWERLWPWLFVEEPSDCMVEWKSLCRMYRVCFDGPYALQKYRHVWDSRSKLREDLTFWKELWKPGQATKAIAKIGKFTAWMDERLADAVKRGADDSFRANLGRMGKLGKDQ